MAINITPPKNITHLFGNWLKGIDKTTLKSIRVGVCAVLWAMWNVRNDFVFNKPKKPSFWSCWVVRMVNFTLNFKSATSLTTLYGV